MAALGARAALRSIQLAALRPAFVNKFPGGFESTMSRREAFHILNLKEGAARADIIKAHRKLMVLNHPDAGGSTYIASKVNEAKEIASGKTQRRGPI